jgi:hypothetical protein
MWDLKKTWHLFENGSARMRELLVPGFLDNHPFWVSGCCWMAVKNLLVKANSPPPLGGVWPTVNLKSYN